MAKQLSPEKILDSIPNLKDQDIAAIAKKCAEEMEKREKELEYQIASQNARLQAIRSNGGNAK